MRNSRKSAQKVNVCGAGATTLMSLLLLSLAAVASAAAQTTIDYKGAAATALSGINDSGLMVGIFYNSDGSEHSFLYDGKKFTTFDYPQAAWTEAAGIDQAGDVVGYYGNVADTWAHGFLRTAAGDFSSMDHDGHFNTMPFGINSAQTIVGCMHNPGTMHGFIMQDGGFVSMSPAYEMYTAINDTGTIVGWHHAAPSKVLSFVLSGTGQVNFNFPGATNTQAYGINVYGAVVGWYGTDTNGHGFLMKDGKFTSIDIPNATLTHAVGINNAGRIVGYYENATGFHGFVL